MIATDDDRSLQLTAFDHVVELQSQFRSLAVAEPADARGQSLELDLLPREINPAIERDIVGKRLADSLIGAVDVLGIAAERHPAKRAASLAELRPNVLRHKARHAKRLFHTGRDCLRAQLVAVVE